MIRLLQVWMTALLFLPSSNTFTKIECHQNLRCPQFISQTLLRFTAIDHSRDPTTDKKIITANTGAEIRNGYLKKDLALKFTSRF
jgi:hypothetical protein